MPGSVTDTTTDKLGGKSHLDLLGMRFILEGRNLIKTVTDIDELLYK
ncbi:hypothetical protein SRABI133_03219 [Peribacillus simplex]|jgi:hypothetical protein|uniref:Uncharacterized protein n=1 Tax=Peribacillus simplex TaxID=1478 RepID=A0A9W4PG63_9BACI|nr:hypothetical protein SRABI133_03219 [Peribacillus simplex]